MQHSPGKPSQFYASLLSYSYYCCIKYMQYRAGKVVADLAQQSKVMAALANRFQVAEVQHG